MKSILSSVLAVCTVALVCGGCTKFNGQWLEQPTSNVPSSMFSRRAAIEFDGISTVWLGAYNNELGLVDGQTVQSDTFTVFADGKNAQFGGVFATVDGDTMRTISAGNIERLFTKVKGKSIFPPKTDPPKLSKANAQHAPAYANATP